MKQNGKGPHVDARRRPHVYADADKRSAKSLDRMDGSSGEYGALDEGRAAGGDAHTLEPPPIVVKGRNVEVTSRVHSYIEKRLAKLSKQLPDDTTRVEVELIEERNPRVADAHIVEATIWTKGPTLRAREASHDVFASIDLVAEKLLRQVRRYREKRTQYKRGHGNVHGRYKSALRAPDSAPTLDEITSLSPDMEIPMAYAETPLDIVRTKQFRGGLMTPEEAAEQMALFGHEFFVFVNAEDGETSVLYKRSDGQLGLIEAGAAERAS